MFVLAQTLLKDRRQPLQHVRANVFQAPAGKSGHDIIALAETPVWMGCIETMPRQARAGAGRYGTRGATARQYGGSLYVAETFNWLKYIMSRFFVPGAAGPALCTSDSRIRRHDCYCHFVDGLDYAAERE